MDNSFDIAFNWLNTTRVLPTRSLQLSISSAKTDYEQLTDFSIALSIIHNNPSLLEFEQRDIFDTLSNIIKLPSTKKKYNKIATTKNKYSATINPIKPVLAKYLYERRKGMHPFVEEEDFSSSIITQWIEQNPRLSLQNEYIEVIGGADYLRLIARAVMELPEKWLVKGEGSYVPSLGKSLQGTGIKNKKELSKFLKKISRTLTSEATFFPEHQDVVLLLSNGRIYVRPLSYVNDAKINFYQNDYLPVAAHNLLLNKSAIHIGNDPILELESLLNSLSASENDFQDFFKKYPKLLLGTDYSRLISHPVLVREDEQDLIPDFILIPNSFSSPKIVDLKLPTFGIASHKTSREGYLSQVIQARNQLLEYKNYFSSPKSSDWAKTKFGCHIYLPKIAVVIGRSESFCTEYERRKIESRMPDIEVITYDDILEKARYCKDIIYS